MNDVYAKFRAYMDVQPDAKRPLWLISVWSMV